MDIYTGKVSGNLSYQPGNAFDGLCDLEKVPSASLLVPSLETEIFLWFSYFISAVEPFFFFQVKSYSEPLHIHATYPVPHTHTIPLYESHILLI